MDYNKLKVVDLREELKKRGIPTTKLTRKQEIIDALEEHDRQDGAQDESEETPAAVGQVDGSTGEEPAEEVVPETRTETAEENAEESMAQPGDASTTTPPPEMTKSDPGEEVAGVRGDSEAREVEKELLAQGGKEVVEPSAQPVVEESNPEPALVQDVDTPNNVTTRIVDPSASATPAAASEELVEESKKRKRRSPTPPLREESVSKKLKQSDGDVVLEKDDVMADAPVAINGEGSNDVVMEDNAEGKSDVTVVPMASSDDVMEVSGSTAAQVNKDQDVDMPSTDILPADSLRSPHKVRSPNDRRYANLLPGSTDAETPVNLTDDSPLEVSPAIHPATRALYIRDLIRPLNPSSLKDQLLIYATPPDASASASEDTIEVFHLDALRTHAFVIFKTISMASRVRASMHARVWPPEPTRKPLWADFIPEEKVQQWVDLEMSKGGARPSQAKKWEVLYDVSDDGVTVELVEPSGAGVTNGHRSSTGPSIAGAPTGPRGGGGFAPDNRRTSEHHIPPPRQMSRASPIRPQGQDFLELDKLFKSTSNKPKLYWLPVSKDLVDKRLDEFDRQTARDWDPREDARLNPGESLGRGLDQLKRYTFEDGDVLVDGGVEYGGGRAFGRAPGAGRRGGGRFR